MHQSWLHLTNVVWTRTVNVLIAGGMLLGLVACGPGTGERAPAVDTAGADCPTVFISLGNGPILVPRRIKNPCIPAGTLIPEGSDIDFIKQDLLPPLADLMYWPGLDEIELKLASSPGEERVQAVVYEYMNYEYYQDRPKERVKRGSGTIYIHTGLAPGHIVTVATTSASATVATNITVTDPPSEAAVCDADAKRCIRMVPDGRTVEFNLNGAVASDWTVTGCPTARIEPLNPASGTLAATFTMVADNGSNDTCQVEINSLAAARFTATPNPATPGQVVNFDASTSSVPNGTIVSYEWDFTNDGSIDASGMTAQTTFAAPGTYTTRLRVTDNTDLFYEITQSITVDNTAPTPTFTLIAADPQGNEITGPLDRSDYALAYPASPEVTFRLLETRGWNGMCRLVFKQPGDTDFARNYGAFSCDQPIAFGVLDPAQVGIDFKIQVETEFGRILTSNELQTVY